MRERNLDRQKREFNYKIMHSKYLPLSFDSNINPDQQFKLLKAQENNLWWDPAKVAPLKPVTEQDVLTLANYNSVNRSAFPVDWKQVFVRLNSRILLHFQGQAVSMHAQCNFYELKLFLSDNVFTNSENCKPMALYADGILQKGPEIVLQTVSFGDSIRVINSDYRQNLIAEMILDKSYHCLCDKFNDTMACFPHECSSTLLDFPVTASDYFVDEIFPAVAEFVKCGDGVRFGKQKYGTRIMLHNGGGICGQSDTEFGTLYEYFAQANRIAESNADVDDSDYESEKDEDDSGAENSAEEIEKHEIGESEDKKKSLISDRFEKMFPNFAKIIKGKQNQYVEFNYHATGSATLFVGVNNEPFISTDLAHNSKSLQALLTAIDGKLVSSHLKEIKLKKQQHENEKKAMISRLDKRRLFSIYSKTSAVVAKNGHLLTTISNSHTSTTAFVGINIFDAIKHENTHKFVYEFEIVDYPDKEFNKPKIVFGFMEPGPVPKSRTMKTTLTLCVCRHDFASYCWDGKNLFVSGELRSERRNYQFFDNAWKKGDIKGTLHFALNGAIQKPGCSGIEPQYFEDGLLAFVSFDSEIAILSKDIPSIP
ncbi:hypothetical protein HK100_002987, partial [Physocladia obscura]